MLPAAGPDAPQDRPLADMPGPAGPLAITAFGTSLTARGTWPAGLETALAACLGRPVRVTVLAGPGAGSDRALAALPRLAALTPDIVLVEFAINDADILDGPGLAGSIDRHDRLLGGIARDLPGARVLLMTTNPAYGPRGWVRPRLAAHYAAYRDLAARHGTGLADFHPRWQALVRSAGNPYALIPDGLHPEPEAAAGLMVPVLADIIAQAAGQGACAAP
jgi:lysophospholipase L1-like esterase